MSNCRGQRPAAILKMGVGTRFRQVPQMQSDVAGVSLEGIEVAIGAVVHDRRLFIGINQLANAKQLPEG